jgi:hypothetical protein
MSIENSADFKHHCLSASKDIWNAPQNLVQAVKESSAAIRSCWPTKNDVYQTSTAEEPVQTLQFSRPSVAQKCWGFEELKMLNIQRTRSVKLGDSVKNSFSWAVICELRH